MCFFAAAGAVVCWLTRVLILATVTGTFNQTDKDASSDHAFSAMHSVPRTLLVSQVTIEHKDLLPLNGRDIGLFVISLFALLLSAGAGAGGGVIIDPTLLLVAGFDHVSTAALYSITICVSSLGNTLMSLCRVDPDSGAPIVNWDLVLMFAPASMLGASAGSYINMAIPGWLAATLLMAVLIFLAWRVCQKARTLYKMETKKTLEALHKEAVLQEATAVSIKEHQLLITQATKCSMPSVTHQAPFANADCSPRNSSTIQDTLDPEFDSDGAEVE
jgi:hypothetical protein